MVQVVNEVQNTPWAAFPFHHDSRQASSAGLRALVRRSVGYSLFRTSDISNLRMCDAIVGVWSRDGGKYTFSREVAKFNRRFWLHGIIESQNEARACVSPGAFAFTDRVFGVIGVGSELSVQPWRDGDELLCVLLDNEPRFRQAHALYARSIKAIVEYRAATTVQAAWRRAISDPAHTLCRRRLIREFSEVSKYD